MGEVKRPTPLACPACGSLELQTEETILGTCKGEAFLVEEAEERTFDFDGWTEVHWDTSCSTKLECQLCGWSVDVDDATGGFTTALDLLVVPKGEQDDRREHDEGARGAAEEGGVRQDHRSHR